jgi:hypothetical protein
VKGGGPMLDREEYIEQAYFFRVLRERMAENLATQEILDRVHEEILSTTRLPYAVQFLAAEMRHSGLLSSGFARLSHYFTPFQAFVIRGTENERNRFSMETATLVLQREAEYKAGSPTAAGLFIFQFEIVSRNRLGYDDGLDSMSQDPMYNALWTDYFAVIRRQVGLVDFADIIFLRSDLYVAEQRRQLPDYQPPVSPLFGEKEGKIARANRGRDPLYLFAALQRQLGYPEVPRLRTPDDLSSKVVTLQARVREMEMRLKLMESELRGNVDLEQFGKPELWQNDPNDD